MATPSVLGAYELLRQAIQRQKLQQRGTDSSSMPNAAPGFNWDGEGKGGMRASRTADDPASGSRQRVGARR